MTSPSSSAAWQYLLNQSRILNLPENHLSRLIQIEGRDTSFRLEEDEIIYDFSCQRVTGEVMDWLRTLARERGVRKKFLDMGAGKIVNNTEKRAALHMASRSFSDTPVWENGVDVMPEIRRVRDEVRKFCRDVHSGDIVGSTGKPFRDIVVIGIGGSYLGTEFVATALQAYARPGMRLHYLSNVDIHNFGEILPTVDPEASLWVVVSKSYTTAETLANEALARRFLAEKGLDPSRHIVAVTSKGSPGDTPDNPMLAVFHMFDFIGGRYSVTSAVGGVPLSLVLGPDIFERFLKGAERMDLHAMQADETVNIPLTAALISIWNNNFLGYPAQAIIPYAFPLRRLASHVQQLNMESNGKMVTADGEFLDMVTGTIQFGEPGTNAQHSFFQLAHQGRPFPMEFIGVLTPQYSGLNVTTKGVTGHQELWANLLSQRMALAVGSPGQDRFRHFPGNRPSSLLVLPDLTPERVGSLLSFYEAKTIFEAFIWGINPFDQFGVELGKTLAAGFRKSMAQKNTDTSRDFAEVDPNTRFYLQRLYSSTAL